MNKREPLISSCDASHQMRGPRSRVPDEHSLSCRLIWTRDLRHQQQRPRDSGGVNSLKWKCQRNNRNKRSTTRLRLEIIKRMELPADKMDKRASHMQTEPGSSLAALARSQFNFANCKGAQCTGCVRLLLVAR